MATSSWTFCSCLLCLYKFLSVSPLEGCDIWVIWGLDGVFFVSKALLFLTTCVAEQRLSLGDWYLLRTCESSRKRPVAPVIQHGQPPKSSILSSHTISQANVDFFWRQFHHCFSSSESLSWIRKCPRSLSPHLWLGPRGTLKTLMTCFSDASRHSHHYWHTSSCSLHCFRGGFQTKTWCKKVLDAVWCFNNSTGGLYIYISSVEGNPTNAIAVVISYIWHWPTYILQYVWVHFVCFIGTAEEAALVQFVLHSAFKKKWPIFPSLQRVQGVNYRTKWESHSFNMDS